MATSDSPMQVPWVIRGEASKYISKLYHVSARCRLSPEEELQLLEYCSEIEQKETLAAEVCAFYDKEKLKTLLRYPPNVNSFITKAIGS